MRKKHIAIIACLLALFAVVLSVGTTIAWLVNYVYIGPMQYRILQINSTINMYKGLDKYNTYNSVPDTLKMYENADEDTYLSADDTNETSWNTYTTTTYESNNGAHVNETYAFKLWESKFMLSEDSTANEFTTVTISDMAPSRVFTYKYEITNYAADAKLTCEFKEATDDEYLKYLQCLQVRIVEIDVDGTKAEYTIKDWQSFSTTAALTLITETTLPGLTGTGSTTANNRINFWLQVRMKPEADTPFTESVTLPKLVITLTI